MAGDPELGFAGLLRQLRVQARLTQEELAQAAGISTRAVSDLERGINRVPHKDTARLLAGALGMNGPSGELFVAVARGRAQSSEMLSVGPDPAPGSFAAAASRSLPRDIASFTGRQAELARLLDEIDIPAAAGIIDIWMIDGMAGIGKTALAVHAAHKLADRFPDGQFFLQLHAHTRGQKPVDPADSLMSLLLTAGLSVQQIPPSLEARAARWRDQVAGKKVLLVLDDAGSHEHVAPLLPGGGGSLVLITSRRRLTAVQDAAVISLDPLRPDEATALLTRLAGRSEIKPDSAAAMELTRQCAYLPLAIGMLASQLRHHPAWAADQLAADLAQARDRLAVMRAENVSVAAAFDLSYQDLSPGGQRLFRRLGLVPGPMVDAYAAAALDDTSPDEARSGLVELYDQHLLTEPGPGRYQLHDLLRNHASALAAFDDSEKSGAALRRLLDYYLYTAAAADRLIARRPPSGTTSMAATPYAVPRLASRPDAEAWLSNERANLEAAIRHAAASGYPVHSVWIPAHLAAFLATHGYWDQAFSVHQAAASIAATTGDEAGHATALHNLSLAHLLIGDYPAAIRAQQEALGLNRALGAETSQIDSLNVLGRAYTAIDDSAAGAASAAEALSRARTADDRLGQADALRVLGSNAEGAGDYPAAVDRLAEAVGLYRELGDQLGTAFALAELGVVRQRMGDYREATRALTEALTLCRALGEDRYAGEALARLGGVYRLTGDYQAAASALHQALDVLRDLNAPHPKLQALSELGALQYRTGEHEAAATSLTHALKLAREVGDRQGQAYILNHLGAVQAHTVGAADGLACHRRALATAREISCPLEEADALAGIGRCHLQAGDTATGIACLQQSLGIYQRIGSPAEREIQQILNKQRI